MARFLPQMLVDVLVVLPVFLLWLSVIALLMRPFGVRLPLSPFSFGQRKFTLRSLTRSQHMWIVGALYWGCGMLIVTSLQDYVDWKFWNASAHHLSVGMMLFRAVLWPMMGLLFGATTWRGNPGKVS